MHLLLLHTHPNKPPTSALPNETTASITNSGSALTAADPKQICLKHWSSSPHHTASWCWWSVALASPHTELSQQNFLAHPSAAAKGLCCNPICLCHRWKAEPINPVRIKPASPQHIGRQSNSLSFPPAPLYTDAFSITDTGQEKKIKRTTLFSIHLKLGYNWKWHFWKVTKV